MTEPETFRAHIGEVYDPADDEGYCERLAAAWFDSLHQCGGIACGVPALEPIYETYEDDGWHGPMTGYVAVGLACRAPLDEVAGGEV